MTIRERPLADAREVIVVQLRLLDLMVRRERDPVSMDVATRAAIYRFIGEMCEAGAGVLLVSSDLPEVLHLSHRLYVMYRGRIQAEFSGADITEQNVLSYFFEREAA